MTKLIDSEWVLHAAAGQDAFVKPLSNIASAMNLEGQTTTVNYLVGGLVASVTRFDGVTVTISFSCGNTRSYESTTSRHFWHAVTIIYNYQTVYSRSWHYRTSI